MPALKFSKIVSCSSESATNPAANLLNKKKWTCVSGESRAEVVLQFDQPAKVESINLGNEHSAFIEVQAGSSTDGALTDPAKFRTILMATKFMSETDSRNSEKTNQVKCFTRAELENAVASREWDLIKVVVTQVFNKHVEYGIGFVTMYGRQKEVESSRTPAPVVVAAAVTSPPKMIGRFKMRDESPESDEPKGVGIMARWKQKMATNAPLTPPPKTQKPPDRNRATLLYNKADDDDKKFQSSGKKIKKFEESKKPEKVEPKKVEKKPRIKTFNEFLNLDSPPKPSKEKKNSQTSPPKEKKKSTVLDADDEPKVKKKKRTLSPLPSTSKEPTPKRKADSPLKIDSPSPEKRKRKTYSPLLFNSPSPAKRTPLPKTRKPFNRLFEGVVFVISGIQNPERADLRSKALAMGAKYSADWNSSCTHLICAFKNTPKYREVQGKGKIVTKEWIIDGHFHRKHFPWRRYALDDRQQKKDESEGEIEEEVSKAKIDETLAMYDLDYLDDEKPKQNGNAAAGVAPVEVKNPYDASTDDENEALAGKSLSQDRTKIFHGKKFYLHPNLKETDLIKIEHTIPDNGGKVLKNLDEVDFVVSERPLNLPGVTGEVVKPRWIMECLEMECFIPTTRYKF